MPIIGSYAWPTPEEVRILRSTFAALIPGSDVFCEGLYDRLFEADPSVRRLFPDQMSEQRDRMVMLLANAIDLLDSREEFQEMCRACGLRHLKYGARPEQFAIVGDLLMAQLESIDDPKLTSKELQAWRKLVHAIGQEMLSGFSRKDYDTP